MVTESGRNGYSSMSKYYHHAKFYLYNIHSSEKIATLKCLTHMDTRPAGLTLIIIIIIIIKIIIIIQEISIAHKLQLKTRAQTSYRKMQKKCIKTHQK